VPPGGPEEYRVCVVFHGELVDFFPRETEDPVKRGLTCRRRSVKDLIESLGVPHTEVGETRMSDRPVPNSRLVERDGRIDVRPRVTFESWRQDGGDGSAFLFLCDVHLGKLARMLRLLGFDTAYDSDAVDVRLVEISRSQGRILLTRDLGVLMRRVLERGLFVRSTCPDRQVEEILDRLRIRSESRPFTRCLICNGILERIDPSEGERDRVLGEVPEGVKRWCSRFTRCTCCGKIFWQGSHRTRLERRVRDYLQSQPV